MDTVSQNVSKAMTRQWTSWSALDLEVTQKYQKHNLAVSDSQTLFDSYRKEMRYVETGLGQRRLEEWSYTGDVTNDRVKILFSDGKTAADYSKSLEEGTTRDQVYLKRTFGMEAIGMSERPFPLNVLYLGDKPLYAILDKAKRTGESERLGRDCDVFTFEEFRAGRETIDAVYEIDRQSAFPLRLTYYSSKAKHAEGRPRFIWEAESIDVVDGRSLPFHSKLTAYDEKHSKSVLYESRYDVRSLKFDQTYEPSFFRPVITEHSTVFDLIKDTVKAGKPAQTATAVATPAGPPITADEPGGWGFPTIGLGLGGACLGAALLVMVRRIRKEQKVGA